MTAFALQPVHYIRLFEKLGWAVVSDRLEYNKKISAVQEIFGIQNKTNYKFSVINYDFSLSTLCI
jgi:hypothetical protein